MTSLVICLSLAVILLLVLSVASMAAIRKLHDSIDTTHDSLKFMREQTKHNESLLSKMFTFCNKLGYTWSDEGWLPSKKEGALDVIRRDITRTRELIASIQQDTGRRLYCLENRNRDTNTNTTRKLDNVEQKVVE